MSQARFQKMQREKARREKQAAKRERRAARAEAAAADESGPVESPPEPEVLAELAAIHQRFEDGAIDLDEFEDRKRELMSQLDV